MEKTRKAAKLKKEKQYFTGIACIKGHISPRRTSTGECLKCRAVALVEWRKRNPAKVKLHNDVQHVRFAKKLAERSRKYYYLDIEESRARLRKYQKQNLHVFAKAKAKRKAAKLNRTPIWLTEDDYWLIKEAYELASLRTKMFGFPWHVDHILPLQGKTVSGLHVPLNLQVIPAKENLAKGNRV